MRPGHDRLAMNVGDGRRSANRAIHVLPYIAVIRQRQPLSGSLSSFLTQRDSLAVDLVVIGDRDPWI